MNSTARQELDLLSARIGFFNNDNLSVSLWAKNLTDEEYLVGGYDFVTRDEQGNFGPGLGGDTTLIGYYGDPRTVHLTVGYRF